MGPGQSPREQRSCARRGEVSAGVVIVVDDRSLRESRKVGRCLAGISMEGNVVRREGIEHDHQHILCSAFRRLRWSGGAQERGGCCSWGTPARGHARYSTRATGAWSIANICSSGLKILKVTAGRNLLIDFLAR